MLVDANRRLITENVAAIIQLCGYIVTDQRGYEK